MAASSGAGEATSSGRAVDAGVTALASGGVDAGVTAVGGGVGTGAAA